MNAFTQTGNDDTFTAPFIANSLDLAKAAAKAQVGIRGTFDAGAGELTVRGDATPNVITVGRDAAGTILVNDGTVAITGGTPTVANTTEIHVIGRDADDVITAQNFNGPLPHLTLDGGAGNDTITGSQGDDTIIGGAGNDTVAGGRGNDDVQLGSGDDTFTWNPGDGSDVVKGGTGADTLQFFASNAGESIDLSPDGGNLDLQRNIGNVTMSLDGIETINLVALGGADTITVHDLSRTGVQRLNIDLAGAPGSGIGDQQADMLRVGASTRADTVVVQTAGTDTVISGLAAEVHIQGADAALDQLQLSLGAGNDSFDASQLANGMSLTVDGGDGNDRLVGSRGADLLTGGDGNDVVTGGAGNDVAQLGAGNDTFVWNPGDGSDVVEGDTGVDTLAFNGSNIGENIDVSANGARARFFRDVGNVTMDVNGVENIAFTAARGADHVTVNDLTGTDVKSVDIDLGATPGGAGDGEADTIFVNGTAAADSVVVKTVGAETVVTGLAAEVHIHGADAGVDQLTINTLAENDTIDASALAANGIVLQINSGAGNDTIVGSAGSDLINGGTGNDTAFMGAGDDTFVWNPGDASDTVDGQAGADTLQFNGANIAETMDIAANGERVRFFRNVGNVTMDLNAIEKINVVALGGSDVISVHDLTGTGTQQVNIDLGANGSGDGSADIVNIEATDGDDAIVVSVQNGVLVVSGLSSEIRISNFEAGDQIHILGLGGDDVIEASGVPANGPQLVLDGGNGDDVIIGGAGDDILLGGLGDDVLEGGPGQDQMDGGPGNNILIQ